MKAGLLSGVFDPIHLGHLNCAEQAAKLFKLDRVYFVPTAVPPHKKRGGASAHDRYAMAQIAVLDSSRFYVSDIEMPGGRVSYSVDTIRRFKRKFRGDLYFIMGIDAFADIHNWKSVGVLLRSCNFIVVSRPGLDPDENIYLLERKLRAKRRGIGFSHNGRVLRVSGSRYRVYLCAAKEIDVSSTAVRRRLRRGEPIKYLVPKGVEQYIMKVELYRR